MPWGLAVTSGLELTTPGLPAPGDVPARLPPMSVGGRPPGRKDMGKLFRTPRLQPQVRRPGRGRTFPKRLLSRPLPP